MGTFTFKWPHAAEEVYVTGTFDGWSKSEKLEKVGDHFEKTVTLPETGDAIFYKFVVDGRWTTDHTAPIAKDPEGNDNNLLKVEDITKEASPMAAILNTVSPESTTAQLAGQVPLEPKHDAAAAEKKDTSGSEIPGTFPETPAADLDKQFSVNPLPATDFAVNPVKLEPGEKVPKDLASNGIHDNVTLDKESYEKSDRIPGLTGLTAPTDLAPTSIGNIIPESSLPISSGEFLTNSAAPESSTAALAANVPLESKKAPEVVEQSQAKADAKVGDSGMDKLSGDKIEEKAEVEDELLSKVPTAPSTAEGTSGQGTDKSEKTKSAVEYITEGAGAAGVAIVAAGLAAKDAIVNATQSETAQNAAQQATDAASSAKDSAVASSQSAAQQTTDAAVNAKDAAVAAATNAAAQLPESVKNALPASVQAAIPAPETKEEIIEEISPEVPLEVRESIAESGQGPEATVNTAAVEQKSAVESELLKEVKEVGSIDQQPKTAGNVPEEVKESIKESGEAPEAASSSDAVNKKSAVESELLKEVDTTKGIHEQSTAESKAAESAPHVDLPTPPAVAPQVATPAPDVKTEVPTEFPTTVTNGSEPTSPKPAEGSAALPKAVEPPAPAVETPAKSEAAAPSTPAKPAAAAPSSTTTPGSSSKDSPATAERKKKNRLSSFFGKIKEKVAHKDKP